MKKSSKASDAVKPGGVDEYIAACPLEIQGKLGEVRTAIREVAPDAIETVSYFDIPGYSCPGYDYNGMFAWFSFRAPFVRLHVRPQALVDHAREVEAYPRTKAIVSFASEKPMPKALVKKLVKASLRSMKDMAK